QADIRTYMRSCDYVTVTTATLQEYYKDINPKITVIPNAVDMAMYAAIRKKKEDYQKDNIVLGWAGSSTHYKDLQIVAPVLKNILVKYPNVTLLIAGFPDCPLFTDIPVDRIIKVPWLHNVLDYIDSIGKIDIGICPLVDSTFNSRKSNIKYLEYSAAGIPSIVSDVPAYQTAVKHKKTGELVKPAYQ